MQIEPLIFQKSSFAIQVNNAWSNESLRAFFVFHPTALKTYFENLSEELVRVSFEDLDSLCNIFQEGSLVFSDSGGGYDESQYFL